MRKILLLIIAVYLVVSATPAYAWVGSGNVYKYDDAYFWVSLWTVEGPENRSISYNATLTNSFVYGGGIQESYNHQIYGTCEYETEMDQFVVGGIKYYENGALRATISRERDVNVWHTPDEFQWGWGNYSTRVRNYYPGGPDYVRGLASWYGSSWIGSVFPNYDEIPLVHYYR